MTTTDELALLRGILVNPADDAPRLVYADWLEEHGQAERGAFIRAQVELARPHRCPGTNRSNTCLWCMTTENVADHHVGPGFKECGRRCRLRARERELLLAHARQWVPGELVAIAPGTEVWFVSPGQAGHTVGEFRRGFISHITLPGDQLADAIAALTWAEGDEMECPACKGSKWVVTFFEHYEGTFPGRKRCPTCEATPGRVPRPMPPGAQPITEIVLTSQFFIPVELGFDYPAGLLAYFDRHYPRRGWSLVTEYGLRIEPPTRTNGGNP